MSGSSSTKLAIPRAAFARLARSILRDSGLRIRARAIDRLHACAEAHLQDMFRAARVCAMHNGRSTVRTSDVQTAKAVARILRPGVGIAPYAPRVENASTFVEGEEALG